MRDSYNLLWTSSAIYLGSPRVSIPNRTLIRSAIFAQRSRVWQTDRKTDRWLTLRYKMIYCNWLHWMHKMWPKTEMWEFGKDPTVRKGNVVDNDKNNGRRRSSRTRSNSADNNILMLIRSILAGCCITAITLWRRQLCFVNSDVAVCDRAITFAKQTNNTT